MLFEYSSYSCLFTNLLRTSLTVAHDTSWGPTIVERACDQRKARQKFYLSNGNHTCSLKKMVVQIDLYRRGFGCKI
jgi:hypothetical protein